MDDNPQPASLDIAIVEQMFVTTALLKKSGDGRIFKRFGLTTSLFAILVKIAAGKNTISDLQAYIEGTPASITQKLGQLEEKGIILRRLDEQDKRRWFFDISEKGQHILAELRPVYRAQLESLLEPYDEATKQAFLEVLRGLEIRLRMG